AAKYGFDDWRGTIYHTDAAGLYTGEITPMWDSRSKEKALFELAEQYDLDLSASYSYGDTNGDLTMFRHTGHPCAINPTRELLENIRKDEELCRRMRVIVERKNVIYSLDINHLDLVDND
ncbi:MAG: HAD hydrolase family protein, partial [Solobacterium sp.]|nr:HAD hydrolase family protein [Solobacterium sp.]